MSTTIYHPWMDDRRRRHRATRGLGPALDQVEIIGRAAERIVRIATEAQSAAVRQAFRAIGFRHLPRPSFDKARACGLPRHHCPSADLGEIRKVIDRSEQVELTFRVRNTTRSRRTFTLAVRSDASQGSSAGASVTLTPPSVDLDPGEIQIVRVQVDATQYEPGVAYHRTITIAARNCETMRLGVCVEIARHEDCAPLVDLHCCCEPRSRPLRWYDHYYCDPAPEEDAAAAEPMDYPPTAGRGRA